MCKKLKYITYKDSDGCNSGVIFPELTNHDVMAKRLRIHPTSIIGAGFCYFKNDKLLDDDKVLQLVAYGESISLNKKSSDIDSMILTREYLGLEYTI